MTTHRTGSSQVAGRGAISIFEKLRTQATSSKFQTPSSKEAPGPNHQTPSSKHQRSSKLQVPSSKRGQRFGAWNLGFLWCLELGFWCFDSGISLELAVWCLVVRSAVAQKLRGGPVKPALAQIHCL